MSAATESARRAPGADGLGHQAPERAYDRSPDRPHHHSHPAPAPQLLARLDGVRRTGDGRWLARCPAHDDRTPSLSVRVTGDGTVLLHDHAGCSPTAVLSAVDMQLSDLFPARCVTHSRPQRRPWHAIDVLAALATEATVAAVAAGNLAGGHELTDSDRERLAQAAGRLSDGARMARGVLS